VKGHNDVAVYVARNLRNFGLSALEKDEGIINKIVWTLEDVGKKFVEYELEKALKQAAWALLELGTAAREKGLEKALKQAAQSLARLTLSAEEIVKTAIQEYESMLKEQERASFQQFKELYEQELEKLRAEKKDAV
jgi:biotin-(acetyl-CoA carboxylase) ligase